MRQLSLLDNLPALASVVPAIRAAMRRAAGDPEGEGRKRLADRINAIAKNEEVRLTSGNVKGISKETLDKWLSPSDVDHPPSIQALVAFCRATKDVTPIQILLKAVDTELDVMTAEDKRFRDLGKASVEMEQARKRLKRAKEAV